MQAKVPMCSSRHPTTEDVSSMGSTARENVHRRADDDVSPLRNREVVKAQARSSDLDKNSLLHYNPSEADDEPTSSKPQSGFDLVLAGEPVVKNKAVVPRLTSINKSY